MNTKGAAPIDNFGGKIWVSFLSAIAIIQQQTVYDEPSAIQLLRDFVSDERVSRRGLSWGALYAAFSLYRGSMPFDPIMVGEFNIRELRAALQPSPAATATSGSTETEEQGQTKVSGRRQPSEERLKATRVLK